MDNFPQTVQIFAMPYPGNLQKFIQDKVAEAGSPELFAKEAMTSHRSVYNWLNGTIPRRSTVNQLAEALGIEVDEIYEYQGKPRRAAPSLLDPCVGCENFKLIPLVKARPICGTGGLETDGDYLGWYSFRREFLQRKGNPDAMRLFMPKGDSMEPTIMEGDMILVDTSQKNPTTGQIALVRIDDEIMVKRIERRLGLVVLKSDNPNYEPIPITPENEDGAEIYGRMVWACREY